MNPRKVERVARAICWEASGKHPDTKKCLHCEAADKSGCTMVQDFWKEAQAAIKEIG